MNGKRCKRVVSCFLVLMLVLSAWNVSAESVSEETSGKILTAGNPDQTFEGGSRTGLNGISVVSLYGTWYEMGRQYGALMKNELGEAYNLIELIRTYNVGNYRQASSIIEQQVNQTPYRINEFFRGASETSEMLISSFRPSTRWNVSQAFRCVA